MTVTGTPQWTSRYIGQRPPSCQYDTMYVYMYQIPYHVHVYMYTYACIQRMCVVNMHVHVHVLACGDTTVAKLGILMLAMSAGNGQGPPSGADQAGDSVPSGGEGQH